MNEKDNILDGGGFDDVVVTGEDLQWHRWAVVVAAIAALYFLTIQK